jgi:DNA repair protein RadC
MPRKPNADERRKRYRRVLERLPGDGPFTAKEAKAACPEERAVFVTRVLGRLEEAGLLVRESGGGSARYVWHEVADAEEAANRVLAHPTLPRTPPEDRPRERLLAHGAPALRMAELCAILVRSGRPGESALQAGEKLAAEYGQDLPALARAEPETLRRVAASVTPAAYCQLMAGLELGRRAAEAAAAGQPPPFIGGADDAIAYCRRHFARLAEDGAQEELHVLTLNTKHRVLAAHRVSRGGLDGAGAPPRDVLRPAVADTAAAVILVHNHPSGDPTPSAEDRAVTERLKQAGRLLEIELLDHIVVARHGVESVRRTEAAPR